MPPTTTNASPALNAGLGTMLAVANGLLFYGYFFFFDVSENDRLFYGPVLVSFLAAQLLALALGSEPPFRRWFWGGFAVLLVGALLGWAAFAYIAALARAFRN